MKLGIITDANKQIGLGHLTRQIAFAGEAVQNGFEITFYAISPFVAEYCTREGFSFYQKINWEIIFSEILHKKLDAVIIDVHQKDFKTFYSLSKQTFTLILMVSEVGYNFTPFGNHLIRIGSDMHEWDVLNQHFNDKKKCYLHSGRSWMIFRNEFNSKFHCKKEINHILIAHGGTDPYKLTELSIEAMECSEFIWNIDVLITSQYDNKETIYNIAKKSKHNVIIIENAKNVAQIMQKATVAIINGGNIRYELCLTKTPFVAISFQQTQYICTEQITNLGVGNNCGHYKEIAHNKIAYEVEELLTNDKKRELMIKNMDGLFDFQGIKRILKLL